ncbi:MAG: hypothetical protein A2X50_16855 [Candidatus Rokubacteria bacterium GWF2_70_14]|nr:MAG: hypothetical protein A2X53_17240 [Candidatus Rokubacteria bacterium GWA2_70_23]OGK90465.1 MAG: hypothetical protein A2X50_16855 [Candidatus Rokubacteria bacterium GWF2_70_14]
MPVAEHHDGRDLLAPLLAGQPDHARLAHRRALEERVLRDARLYVFAPLTSDRGTDYLGERWLGLSRSF